MRRHLHAAVAGIALVGALGLALAACGDDETSGTRAPTNPSDAAAQRDCEAQPGDTVTVEIGDFAFDPTPVQVDVCDTVVWHNSHTQPHTSSGNADQTWSTGNLEPDASSEPIAFPTAGDFSYVCALHPFMTGTVQVS